MTQRRTRSLHGRPTRWPAAALTVAMVAGLTFVGALPAGAAAVTITKSAPATALVGGPVRYTLTATNPNTGTPAPEYNLSFRDQLAAGVAYLPGSTSPASAGEPTVISTGTPARQTLLWRNVADLPIGATHSISFTATPAAATFPVGATVPNAAAAYANTDPRTVPAFTATGVASGGATQSATSAPTSTAITAMSVVKTEASPEGELLRGVHDHSTVYTVTTTNNTVAATSAVTVVDLIPAGLEFVGCGTVDNSTTREYATAPALSVVPDLLTGCPLPASVSTVLNPPGRPAGVYTRVQWDLGSLAPGQQSVINYRAGIPQRANTMVFPAGTPAPSQLGQTANLDNNSGASTREAAAEVAYVNQATASGTYSGPVATGASSAVSASATATVTTEDVALVKTVSPGTFSGGGIATYTLTIRAGQYADATAITLTDTLPDGLCPLSATSNYQPGAPAECGPVPGSNPTGAGFASVTANPSGTFTIVFTPVTVASGETRVVTFRARMRATFTAGNAPTVSGNTYLNSVALTATTTPRGAVAAPAPTGPVTVGDVSSASLSSDAPTLTKKVQPDVLANRPYACSSTAAAYRDDLAPSDATLTFDEGDRVCFLLRVDFSSSNSTRNAVLTDFLPPGATYQAGSATLTANNTVAATASVTDPLTWSLGTVSGASRFVAPGGVFEVRLAALVSTPAPGPAPDLTANLAKLRWENSPGAVSSLRDAVDLSLAAAPPVAVVKTARRLSPAPVATLLSNAVIAGGQSVEYTVGVTNNGSAANRNALDVVGPDVWDVLADTVTCAQVTAISDAGVCYDPASGGYPVARAGFAGRSIIRWDLPNSFVIAPAASRSLTYVVAVLDSGSVSRSFLNTAAVSSYQTPTDTGGLADHAPATNIAAAITVTDTPAAQGTLTLRMPDATITKSAATAVTEPGNTAAQGTVGETITYTYAVTVPARTRTYNGVLADPLPAGLIQVGPATATYFPNSASATTAALPAGFVLDSATGTLTFPSSWTNTLATPSRFTVTFTARPTDVPGNVAGTVLTNRATFNSRLTDGGTPVAQRITGNVNVTVVEPAPTLTKAEDDPDDVVVAGQQVTYTLTATNTAGRPPLHDAFVVDCVPAGLTLVAGSPTPALRISSASTGTDGCASGTTRIEWSLGDLAGGATATMTYRATVSTLAGGAQAYTNTAQLSGSTLDQNKVARADTDLPYERAYTRTASRTLTVAPAAATKDAASPTYPVGARGTWTVVVSVPADTNFYDSAVIDRLPAGIDPASALLTSITCTDSAGACPVPGGGSALTSVPVPGGATDIGWLIGDLTASPRVRTISLTYSALVTTAPANVRASTRTNTATIAWNATNAANPTSAAATFAATSLPDPAVITLTEPVLSLAKSADDTTPAPGQIIGYSVVVTNATGADISAAHDITVVDTVPLGVVVTLGSISNGGVLTGQTSGGGGGTITWTLTGPVNPAASRTLTYSARLASPTRSTPLVNSADITAYRSQPAGGGRLYDGPTSTATVTAALPHVSVVKSVLGSGPAYLGEPTTWRVRVDSDGTSPAYGVDVSDLLPPGWTFDPGSAVVTVAGAPLSAAASAPTVSGSPQTLTWTDLGTLPVGTAVIVTYTATPTPAVITSPGVGRAVDHTNTAATTTEDVDGAQGPAGGGSYAGPAARAVAQIDSANLAVDKSHTATPVAGRSFDWTIGVTNTGPDLSVGPFTVTDRLPAEVTGGIATGTGWSCTTAGRDITCTRPAGTPLAVGASLPTLTVSTTVPSNLPAGTVLTNGAAVTARTYDPTAADDSDTDQATVTAAADVAVSKAVSGPVVAGQDATWTIDLTNLGPSTSRGPLTLTDLLPAGTSLVSATGAGWTCDRAPAGLLRCALATDVLVGPAPQLTVVAAVPSGQLSDLTNTATLTGTTTPDPAPGNDQDRVVTTPGTSADLAVRKTSRTPVTAGEQATYRFTVANGGPSDAVGVTVTDTLPAGLTYLSATAVTGTWTCTATGQDVRCDLAGSLVNQGNAAVDVVVEVASTVTGAVRNTARVTATTGDPVPGNDSDDDDSTVNVSADLRVAKSHTGPVVAGRTVSYEVVVTNGGPSRSPGPITVVDRLPAEISAVSAGGTGWTCTVAPARVECTRVLDLAVGASAPPITLVAEVNPAAGPATLDNVAVVTGPADNNPGNDTATDPTVVVDEAEVALTKTAGDPTPVAGSTTTFDLEATNTGPSDADNVTVIDTPPAGMTATSATGAGWACVVTGVVTCTRPTLAAGATAPALTVTVALDSGLPFGATLANTATISTATPGDRAAGNVAGALVTLRTRTDLAVTKAHESAVVAGQALVYTLDVRSAGPSDAPGPIALVDDLPAGVTFLAATGAGWVCTQSGPPAAAQVACAHPGSLPAGSSAPTLRLRVMVGPDTRGSLTNIATLASRADDTDVANDSAQDRAPVQAVSDLTLVKSHQGAAVIGVPLDFTLTVTSSGPSSADRVVVSDTLPAGLTYVSARGTGWTCAAQGQVVTCGLDGSLAAGTGAPVLTVSALVDAAAYPGASNSASVTSRSSDPTRADATSVDPFTVAALADLSLSKAHQGELVVGAEASYRIEVRNGGPTRDPGPLTVTDVLPAGLSLVTAGGEGWACSTSGDSVVCTRAAGLDVGATAGIDLRVRVGPAAYPTVVNTASVDSPAADASVNDNAGTDRAPVTAVQDLTLSKTVRSFEDGIADYAITVTNRGPVPTSAAVVVVDDLPAQLALRSAGGRGWSCPSAQDVVTCSHPGVVAVGESITFTVKATLRTDRVSEGDVVTNVAVLVGPTSEAPTASGSADVTVGGNTLEAGVGGGGSGLPRTGAPAPWLGVTGLLLLAAGGVLLGLGRRRC